METNKDIYHSYEILDIVSVIERRKIQWLGHVKRIEQIRIIKRTQMEASNVSKERPSIRCRDQFEEDLRKQKVTSSMEWRKVLKEVKAFKELLSTDDDGDKKSTVTVIF